PLSSKYFQCTCSVDYLNWQVTHHVMQLKGSGDDWFATSTALAASNTHAHPQSSTHSQYAANE
ncbi:MAG: hypothetical protein WBZ36_20405, partial [Candidatus Nitrosopolaris sp.]